MTINCCVFDLDGTLLDTQSNLSQENISAVAKLHDKGIKIILATGRSDLLIKDITEVLNVRNPVISSNGGLIRNATTGEILFSQTIDPETAKKTAEYLLQKKYNTLVYTPNCIYYFDYYRQIDPFQHFSAEFRSIRTVSLKAVQTIEDLPLEQVNKFLLYGIDPVIAKKVQLELSPVGNLTLIQSMSEVLDIMTEGISKGKALLFLSKMLGFDLSQTAVIGDNYNDLSMLNIVGYPLTVMNAATEVKKIAKFIAPSNDESGVAFAIDNYILEGNC